MEHWESLLEELRKEFILREDELELLHSIDMQLLGSERPLNTTFNFIVHETKKLLEASHVTVFLRRGRFVEPAYTTYPHKSEQLIEISSSLIGECITSDSAIRVPNVNSIPDGRHYVSIDDYAGSTIQSLLATPIKAHETMVGALCAESTRLDAFTHVHENVITAIAAQVAIALQRAQLFDRSDLFADVDQLVLAASDSQQAIQSALQRVLDAMQKLEHVKITVADIMFRHGKDLEVVHSTNPAYVGLILSLEDSICGRAVRERRTVVVGDVNTEHEYHRVARSTIQSEIAVPIFVGEDRTVIGTLNVESAEPDAFQGFSQVILESFADKVTTLLAFAKLRSDLIEALEVRNADNLLVAVGDQTTNMIHRLNNTVGVMRFRILELQQTLEESGEIDPAELADTLQRLLKLADRTLKMPEEITRILSQQESIVDVSKSVATALQRLAIPDNVKVVQDLDLDMPNLCLYCFDEVIENLLQNALDAMPKGGVLSVSTSFSFYEGLTGGSVQLVVKDTGSGIAADILPKIFELNFTTKHAKGKGHGLGLWWIRSFVRRARGDITVNSKIGEGSTFTVRLPYEIPAQSTATEVGS